MATNYTRTVKAPAAPDQCAPVCPACGLLECLCRPRFFAGQLLSEDDLNRLEDYILKKNRLHNRYLIGWGVVCGLEVLCDPCGEGVTVRPGYALSPCGDDIIVCNQEIVVICDLIKKCKRQDPNDCLSPSFNAAANNRDDCLNGTEDWILSICYDEKPSRGVTPLQQPSGCASCSCGGSGSCGCKSKSSCGCGGTRKCTCGSTSSTKTTSTQQKPAQCEPTVVCESYRFAVCKKPPVNRLQELEDRLGALLRRIQDCQECVEAHQIPVPANRLNLQQWCCDMRDSLLDYLASNPGTDCSLYDRVRGLCNNNASISTIYNEVGDIIAELKQQCACLAWLPPCPAASDENCVPLATITIRKRDCRILEICNFSARKFAVTLPNLGYWLSPLGVGYLLRRVLEAYCCEAPALDPVGVSAGRVDPGAIKNTPVSLEGYVSYMARAQTARGKQINLKTLSLAQMGVPGDNGQPLLSADEMANSTQALLAGNVLQPFSQQALGEDVAALFTDFLSRGGSVSNQIEELRNMLDRQSKIIADLQSRMGGR